MGNILWISYFMIFMIWYDIMIFMINSGQDEMSGVAERVVFCCHAGLFQFSSVQFSHSVMSDSLRPHESQHARLPCPSPTPGVHSNSCLSSQWCHSAISSSVVPFSSCPQSLPASESFPMSQLFSWAWNNRLVPNRKRSTSRLYIVTLLI